MKTKLIILFAFGFCHSNQLAWSQEAPKLASFSIGEKAPENTSKGKTAKQVLAIWGQEPREIKSRNILVPELAASKIEAKPENLLEKTGE